MTTTPHTTSATEPEALRLADSIDQAACIDYYVEFQTALRNSAAELRRQHARIAELEAELEAVGAGGVQALAASAPVAPAPQPAPMPYPTDAQVDAVYEQTMGQHLRSQDAPAVRRFGRAMFLCAWNAAAPKAYHIADASKMVPALLQQGEYLPLPEGWPARFRCDSCEGNGEVGEPMHQGYFQPPEKARCPECSGVGWSSEEQAYNADHVHTAIDADRAARGAAQTAPANGDTASPFGYFRAEPFGWTDCAESDEGARPLYDKPPAQEEQLNPDMPTQELRLHMGELTTDEVLVARAAIRWANTYGITAAQK